MHSVDTSGLPIGTALKVERSVAGLTLTRIALAVGISIGQLSRIESGQRTASTETVEKIRIAIRAGRERAA